MGSEEPHVLNRTSANETCHNVIIVFLFNFAKKQTNKKLSPGRERVKDSNTFSESNIVLFIDGKTNSVSADCIPKGKGLQITAKIYSHF